MSWSRSLRAVASRLALGAALAGLFGGLVAASPALAAPDYPAAMQITKIVADDTLGPSDTLSYTITIDCSTTDCVDARVVDVLPPEFDALTLNPTVVVTGGPSTYSWGGPNNRTLTVVFTTAVTGGTGIPAGEGYSVQVSLQVPPGLSPDWPSNGVPVTNTATATATTAETVSASVPVTVTVPYVVTTTAAAAWAPGTTQFKVGEASTLTLTTRNTSNAKADTLTLLAPTDPESTGNLFRFVDFASFGTVVFPAGSDRIKVDAYVAGAWIDGAFAATAALPDGVVAATVTGLRITFGSEAAGAQLTANGSAGSIVLNLVQRARNRVTDASLVTGAAVTAAVRGTVSVPGHGTHSANTTASYTIGGLTSAVTGTTSFSTTRIPAGGWTISSVTGRNASNGNLAELTVSQPVGAFLTEAIAFGGFGTAGAAWPTGATAATVTWFTTGGSGDPAPVELSTGAGFPATPALEPGQRITGFSIQFRGAIPAGATATVPFRVNVAADAVPASPGTGTFTQTARIDGSNDAGAATPANPTAMLTVVYPQVDVTLLKTVTPSAAVPAGGRSVAQLRATTSTDSGYVSPTTVVITDVMTASATDYWRAFDATAVAPTQIPVGATLLLEGTTDGTTWTTLDTRTATGAAVIYQTALADGDDLVGLRFTFTNPGGFGQGANLQANIAFVARATLRGTTDPTSVDGANGSYQNYARVDATGDVLLGGVAVSDTATSNAAATVKTIPGGGGVGALIFDKNWVPVSGSTTVPSQSGLTRTVRLGWGVEVSGYTQAQVTDPADPTAPVSTTVFQAFDLSRIEAIGTSTDALIKYDKVTNVELYQSGAWVPRFTNACGATGASCLGTFPGYTLSASDRAATTGVRITFAEYPEARASDPLAPPVGSGVASGPDTRRIDLTFQIRNRVRDAAAMTDPSDPWVTGDRTYHTVDNGVVSNTAQLALDAVSTTDSSTIQVIDPVAAVGLTKTQSAQGTSGATITSPISIPNGSDVAETAYPTIRYTMVASNASAARAWYLRTTDQAPCPIDTPSACAHPTGGGINGWTVNPYAGLSWDPATSPFQYLTIRDINYTLSNNSGIVAANSTVTLWYADGTSSTVTLAVAAAMTESQLADVVGVSALFAGATNQDSVGGSIVSGAQATLTLDTRLRKYLRSSPSTLVAPATFTNTAFSQVWDGVLVDSAAYSAQSVSMTLVQADLAVAATTSLSPTSILEANRTVDTTVTMTANQSTSTASPTLVTLENTTAAFWNAFDLRSLGTITLPAGADRARVDVQLNGSSTWTQGTAAASPALPSGVTASQVTGLRVLFFKNDGTLFSTSSPAAAWSGSAAFVVRLRATYRDSGSAITFPSVASDFVVNSATATAEHPSLGSRTATASATLRLDPGTFKVDVEKRAPVTTTPAGETVDFRLIVKNTGTGYLDNPVVTDQLPVDSALIFDPTTEVTYSTSAGGILPTTGVTTSYDSGTSRLTFTWPAGSRLAPGETYTIVLPLQVKPGLSASYGNVVNAFTVTSDRTLAPSGQQGCTNTSGNGQGVSYVGTNGCRTSTYVTTISASAISSFKGVKGDVGTGTTSTTGAVNVNDAATACVADSQGFYRNPCAALTQLGATDLWKVQFTNGGNVAATETTVVDVLPAAGDKYLVTGAARGSTYRPVFAGDVTLATDTTGEASITWEVTTTANPCPAYTSDPVCSTATWQSGPGFPVEDYGQVTAIRIAYALPAGGLPPAATLAVTYRTTNLPTTTAGDGRAPVAVPYGTQRAWNSFGVYAKFGTGFAERRVEPVRAGVQLQTGPIQVAKAITGTTAAYAPTSFGATVSCTVDATGTALTLPSSGAVTLAAANATPYTTRIDGIPIGSTCAIVETTTGASATSYAPAAPSGPARAILPVSIAAAPAVAVPGAQQATITNQYETTTLSVKKAVESTATVGSFGPYEFTVSCTVNNGTTTLAVPLDPSDATFTLADTQSHTISGLPVTARCAVRESDADGADAIAMRVGFGSWTTVAENAPYTVTLGTEMGYGVTVRNTFDSGLLAVRKEVVGDGEADYGAADYGFAIECTYQGDVVFTDSVRIDADDTHTFAPLLPVDTVCAITETDAGGATTAAAAASVMITTGTTTALMTNRFDTGSVRIDKTVVDPTGRYGDGPFEAQLVCTWDAPGAPDSVIPLPDSGVVELSSATGYTGTVTGLIAGAECELFETKTGGATSTLATAIPAITAGGTGVVELENTFSTGSLEIVKHRDIDSGAAAFADGPFTVEIECGIDVDGTWRVLDLDGDETQVLSDATGYAVVVDDILEGASCTVTETDAGLADSHESSTDAAPVVIPAAWAGPARASVTNHFRVGELDVEKTVTETLVQGGDTLHYAIAVENVGDVTAGGVTVTDAIDPDLKVDVAGLSATGWTCDVTGEDGMGYGGTLECALAAPLGVGAAAPGIAYTGLLRDEVAQDEIVNTAVVASTTVVVSGDSDTVQTPVKWLDVDALTECVQDAPWLDYTVDAHNLDVAGRTMQVLWKDAAGTVVHTDTVDILSSGVVTGRLLFPGAAVDAAGDGVMWPGWRAAGPGETPDWENLVLDPTLPTYGLRSGASVEFVINPATTVAIDYPPATPACTEAPDDQDPELWMSKVASRSLIAAGDTFEYTMQIGNHGRGAVTGLILVDDVPDILRIIDVEPADAATASDPAWIDCVIDDLLPSGYGGTVTCELDRDLGYGQQAPDVLLHVQLSPTAAAGSIINTATTTAYDLPTAGIAGRGAPLPGLVTLSLQDSAVIMTPGRLAATGWVPVAGIQLALMLLGVGGLLLTLRRRRTAARHRG